MTPTPDYADTGLRRHRITPTPDYADTGLRRHRITPTPDYADTGLRPTPDYARARRLIAPRSTPHADMVVFASLMTVDSCGTPLIRSERYLSKGVRIARK